MASLETRLWKLSHTSQGCGQEANKGATPSCWGGGGAIQQAKGIAFIFNLAAFPTYDGFIK